jgi:hypothetical protein
LEKIDIGYGGPGEKAIGLIEQSDFRRAGRLKHRRDGPTRGALISGTQSHHSGDVHFE